MPRQLTDGALAAIDQQRSVTHTLVFMDLADAPLYLALGAPHDLTFQRDSGPIIDATPTVWTAIGGAMVVGPAEESMDLDGGGQDVQFAAVDPTFELGTVLLNARPFNRDYQCWRVHYSDAGTTAGTIIGGYLLYHGKLNGSFQVETINPEEIQGAEPGTIRVSFRAMRPTALLDVTRALRTNPDSYKFHYPGDLFMDEVAKTQNRKLNVGDDGPTHVEE